MPKQTKQPRPSTADKTKQPHPTACAKAGDAPLAALALCREDGQFLHVDPALLAALARTQADGKPRSLFDLLADPHDRAAITEELQEKGELQGVQTTLHSAKGSLLPVALSIRTIDCGGKPHLLVLLQGYKGKQHKQRQAEARYQIIFNSVPVAITITDKAGNFCAFNPALCELLGYSAAELRTMNALDVYKAPADRDQLLCRIAQDKKIRDYEMRFVCKDGREIITLLNIELIDFGYLENMMLSSFRDITPLKSIEAQLIKERNFSETVLDTSDSLIMVFTADGRVIKFNKTCEKITGYTFAEVQGRPFWDLVSADQHLSKTRVQQMLADRRNNTFESYWITRDGRKRLISWTNVLLKDEDGNDYIVSTGSDITERRKAHEAVREANRELGNSLRQLEERNRDISLLADMESLLQGCRTVEETCTICAQFIQSICPESSGSVYLISADGQQAAAQERWGDESISLGTFAPMSCWSVRRGRLNLIDGNHRGLPCQHIRPQEGGQYLCIPMEISGETLGILHLSYIPGASEDYLPADGAPYFETKLRLLTTAAETSALSITNIQLQNTLLQQSIRDSLTGIFNRRYMVEALTRELSRAQREQTAVSVLMFDIDHFKAFNDTYGHDGGDTLLKTLGEYLRQNTRAEDIACRYGGEEFVVVLTNTSHLSALQKAEALRVGVSALCVTHRTHPMRGCTISIGAATFPQHGQTAEALLHCVDDALYTAKRKGRNCVVSGKLKQQD